MDRHGRNYRLKPSFSDEIDKQINELEKKARMISKLKKIMNTIKANGLYSDKELQNDLRNLEVHNAPDEEVLLITECWQMRKLANEQLMRDTKLLLEKIKKELMENGKKDKAKKVNKGKLVHG
jgi:translation initiation factor 2 beta subunit (eIF-2beta)/eIF-5